MLKPIKQLPEDVIKKFGIEFKDSFLFINRPTSVAINEADNVVFEDRDNGEIKILAHGNSIILNHRLNLVMVSIFKP